MYSTEKILDKIDKIFEDQNSRWDYPTLTKRLNDWVEGAFDISNYEAIKV